MSQVYRRLFLYLPLVTGIGVLLLMMIPHRWFVPWEFVNLWTIIKACSLSYLGLGVYAFRRHRQLGVHLVIVGGTIVSLAAVGSWVNFEGFYYLRTIDHWEAFVGLVAAYGIAGSNSIKGLQ